MEGGKRKKKNIKGEKREKEDRRWNKNMHEKNVHTERIKKRREINKEKKI